jgi:hypothetical protein
VDGELDDWACIAFAPLDEETAGQSDSQYDGGGVPVSATFAMTWSTDYLYLAVNVVDPNVLGGNTTTSEIALNDSVELFLDGDGQLIGDFESAEHHYVGDWKGDVAEYGEVVTPTPDQFKAAVQKSAGGYTVEAQIYHKSLGTDPFVEGRQLGFDLAIGDGDGSEQWAFLLWFFRPGSEYQSSCSCSACCCNEADDEAWCNTHRFGHLKLLKP